MYYFVPKAANRPVYSYRLSIVHFGRSFLFTSGLAHTIYYIPLYQIGLKTLGLPFQLCYFFHLGVG